MDSACARMTGTRMHVAAICTSCAPQILRVSITIFISSSLYPFSVIGALCENRLNAYCQEKMSIVTGSPFRTPRVCCSSSAIASAPAPDAAWYVEAIMRFTPTARWMGVTAMSAMMVEQLGLAMMPPLRAPPSLYSAIASGFTSGITSGTSGSMRNAEELSTTKQPFAAARGPNFLLMEPPAEKSAMSTPSKESSVSSSMTYVSPSNANRLPSRRSARGRREHLHLAVREVALDEYLLRCAMGVYDRGARRSNRESIIRSVAAGERARREEKAKRWSRRSIDRFAIGSDRGALARRVERA